MKKIAIIITAFIGTVFTSCLKDSPNVDFSTLSPTIQFINAGLGYFTADGLNFNSDTLVVPITINLASVNPLNKDLTVTIGVDANAVTTYNSTSAVKFSLMADSSYSLPATTVTIPAGTRIDTLYVTFYQHTLDPAVSYLLPITITDAQGVTIASNYATHYFHVIGNPIAGTYNWEWIRWNAPDTTGPPTYDLDYSPAIFAPRDPTTVETASGYYYQARYVITFDNNGGVLSNFQVTFDQDDLDTYYTPNGVTMNTPVFLFADPISGQYEIYSVASTSSGPRQLIDYYYKP